MNTLSNTLKLTYKTIIYLTLLNITACGGSSFSGSSSSAKTYYVAPDGDNLADGSTDSPWNTLQFATQQLSAGETLVIRAGSYNETVLLGENDSGTENAIITLKGLDGAIIDGTGLSPISRQGLITLRNAHHITIENLEIANFKTSTGVNLTDTPVGVLIDGSSHHLTLTNNNIHHIENLSTCGQTSGCGSGANGIAVYGDTTTAITDLLFTNNEVANCILSSSEAFTLNGNVDGFKLTGNYVHDNNNIGIDFIGYENDVCTSCTEEQNRARNGIVKNNRSINNSTNLALGTFSNNPWYEGTDGSAGGFYVDGGRNIIFDGNYSSKNDLGFEFASEHPQKSTDDILMINNAIYRNREVGLTIGGYAESDQGEGGGSAKNINVFNNSFYKNKGWGTEIAFSYRVINATLANNIIVGKTSISDNFAQEINNGQYLNIIWENNIWWAVTTTNTTNIQGSSITQDPLYTNPETGNLNLLANSPAINKGIEQTAITTWLDSFWQKEFTNGIIPAHGTEDINGENRLENQLDLGADEAATSS
jgi:hypothetical protein